MRDDSPLVRQWMLLKTLSARHYGVKVREMAGELEVNEKTIRRDLELFRDRSCTCPSHEPSTAIVPKTMVDSETSRAAARQVIRWMLDPLPRGEDVWRALESGRAACSHLDWSSIMLDACLRAARKVVPCAWSMMREFVPEGIG
jgi:hypothetical protein